MACGVGFTMFLVQPSDRVEKMPLYTPEVGGGAVGRAVCCVFVMSHVLRVVFVWIVGFSLH